MPCVVIDVTDFISSSIGVIRDIGGFKFDFLVAVVFSEDWNVNRAVKILHRAVEGISSFRQHVNGYVMHLHPSILRATAAR